MGSAGPGSGPFFARSSGSAVGGCPVPGSTAAPESAVQASARGCSEHATADAPTG